MMRMFAMVAIAGATVLLTTSPSYAIDAVLTDDGYAANDPNRGPGVGGNRSDFFEVRHHEAPRKKIGYLKYDISGIDASLFPSATLSGGFASSSHDNAGVWNIYGLNDGEDNTDNVVDGSFGESNWTEEELSYSQGLGVDVSVAVDSTDLGLDVTEIALLGTITLPGNAPFVSNPTDLPLGTFLNADTNGVVTFLIADANFSGTEWRVGVKENATVGGIQLSFVPEPSSIVLIGLGLVGLVWGRGRGK
jgi:PEP-CTERM motif